MPEKYHTMLVLEETQRQTKEAAHFPVLRFLFASSCSIIFLCSAFFQTSRGKQWRCVRFIISIVNLGGLFVSKGHNFDHAWPFKSKWELVRAPLTFPEMLIKQHVIGVLPGGWWAAAPEPRASTHLGARSSRPERRWNRWSKTRYP